MLPPRVVRSRCRIFGRAVFLAVMICSTAVAQVPAPAGIETVVVAGGAPIVGEDLGGARQAAVARCLAAAVDQVLVTLVAHPRLVSHFDPINGVVSGRTGDFVRDYQVLAETRRGKSLRVLAQVSVIKDAMARELTAGGWVADRRRLPRLLMLVTESGLAPAEPQYWWKEDFAFVQTVSENSLIKGLEQAGFELIRHGGVASNTAVRPINYTPFPGTDSLLAVGQALEADVIVTGQARAEVAPNTMGGALRTFKATVVLKALRTDNGLPLASVTQSAVAAHADAIMGSSKALAEAAAPAGKTLADRMAAAWQAAAEQAAALQITVKGTDELAHFVAFRQNLRGLEGVEVVLTTEMRAEQAVLSVRYSPGAQALADALMLQTFEAFGINIYEVTENHLGIELVPG